MKRTLALMVVLFFSFSSVTASAQNFRGEHLASLGDYVAAVQEDGTVKAVGHEEYGQSDTEQWRDVVAISAYYFHTLGLKADGTVYAAGDNENGECDVDGWSDIAMVVAANECSFGLKRDGTIIWAGKLDKQDKNEIEGWKDIVWIGFRWSNSLFAIDKHGKAYGVGLDFTRLDNVVQVFEDTEEIIDFLLADGTMKTLTPYNGFSKVVEWKKPKWADICEIADAGSVEVFLKRDGTVISDSAIIYFEDWTDVVEIDGGFGVKSDGTILSEDEFVRHLTPEQLDEIYTWKVMVDPQRAKELGADDGARDNPALRDGAVITANGVALRGKNAGLAPGSKYAVYTGPGPGYYRGGGGRALVGTDERMLLYGVDNGWALIQYAVSKDRLCFGYIPLATLPGMYQKGGRLKPVNLSAQAEAAVVKNDTFITDDPYISREVLMPLAAGRENVLHLGTLDGAWAYVQAENDRGMPLRGFAPLMDVTVSDRPVQKVCDIPEGFTSLWVDAAGGVRDLADKQAYVVPHDAAFLRLPATMGDIKELTGLKKLAGVEVSPNSPYFCTIGGVVFSADKKTLLLYPAGKADREYTIPNGVESISSECGLQYAAELDTLVIPSAMTELPAADVWRSLRNVSVSADNPAFSSIGGVLFSKDGTELILYPSGRTQEEYAIPEGTAGIRANYAFCGASSLKTLVLPSTVTNLDLYAEFPPVESIGVSDKNPAYRSIGGVLFSKDGTKLLYYPFARPGDTYTAPPGTREIGMGAFQEGTQHIRHVILPEGLQVIDDGAFENCKSLESVHIPEGVTNIGSGAFENCSNLTTVNIPASLAIIEGGLFRWSGLSGTLKIPEGVESIQDEAFFGVHGLDDLYLPASLVYMDIWANLILNAHSDKSSVTIHAPAGSYAEKIAGESGFDLVIEEP